MEKMKSKVEMLKAEDGCQLALHIWKAAKEKAVLFYIHGMQSNGGWLFETGPYLSERGVSVYVMDRRGSGKSGGSRGNVPNKETLISDYQAAFDFMKKHTHTEKITVLGQSLGGSLLLGLLASDSLPDYEKVIFCAPALGQLHKRLTGQERKERTRQTGEELCNVLLPFEKYSKIPKYLEFMKSDERVITSITKNSQRVFLEMENLYYHYPKKIKKPSMFIAPKQDKIIILDNSKQMYEKMFTDGILLELPIESHYMEFSRHRKLLWEAIIHFAAE